MGFLRCLKESLKEPKVKLWNKSTLRCLRPPYQVGRLIPDGNTVADYVSVWNKVLLKHPHPPPKKERKRAEQSSAEELNADFFSDEVKNLKVEMSLSDINDMKL